MIEIYTLAFEAFSCDLEIRVHPLISSNAPEICWRSSLNSHPYFLATVSPSESEFPRERRVSRLLAKKVCVIGHTLHLVPSNSRVSSYLLQSPIARRSPIEICTGSTVWRRWAPSKVFCSTLRDHEDAASSTAISVRGAGDQDYGGLRKVRAILTIRDLIPCSLSPRE